MFTLEIWRSTNEKYLGLELALALKFLGAIVIETQANMTL